MIDVQSQLKASQRQRLAALRADGGQLVVMTGAGISAESGVPTFRGKEGYWTVGSQVYQPQAMATAAMFARQPESVWSWYLYRRGVCQQASPNAGHQAVVDLERSVAGRFHLITQNVDGLHLLAGSSQQRTYQVHGNLNLARCAGGCGQPRWPLDAALGVLRSKDQSLSDQQRALLRCPACGGWARPHVLWFDECYDEANYFFDSALRAAANASVMLVVGTSGATNLPMQAGRLAVQSGSLVIDVNLEPNPFSQLASASGGVALQGPSGEILPQIVGLIGQPPS